MRPLLLAFASALKPQPWTPPAPEIAKLQAYTRRLAALENMITQEKNRLKTTDPSLEEDIKEHIAFLQQQVKSLKKRQQEHIQAHQNLEKPEKLLTSIVGIGEHTARIILSEIASIEHFSSARQLAAFAGLTPQEHQSGTSVRGRTRLCKIGNPHLRKAFYFPALNAIRRCPQIQAFRERLLEAGKNKMQVVGAVMHKLIRVVYGVLKSGQPFDPNKLLPLQPNCSADLA